MVRECGLCDTISFILTINSIVNLYKVRFISFLIYSQFRNFSAACGCVETVFSSALRTVGVGKLIKSNLTWGSQWTAPCPGSHSPHVHPARDPHSALCSVATCQEPRQGGVSWWTPTTLANCRAHDYPSEHGGPGNRRRVCSCSRGPGGGAQPLGEVWAREARLRAALYSFCSILPICGRCALLVASKTAVGVTVLRHMCHL